MSETDLSDLILRTAQGDKMAFKAFYDATAPRMMGVAMRILGRRDLAEEAVQDAYVSAWKSAAAYNADYGVPIAWITTITRRRAIDRLRASPWLKRDVPDSAEQIVETLSQGEKIDLLNCLKALDARMRYAIVLCYVFGMTHAELSSQTDIPLGTLKSRMRRGLLQLKECLDP